MTRTPPTTRALLPYDLRQRQSLVTPGVTEAAAPLAALADSLARDLEPWLSRMPPIPEQKARLTRIGGRCPTHGTYLEFDPGAPHAHRCATCNVTYHGREHDDWWAMGAQLWTAERAVHAAALFALRGDPRHATWAASVLRELSARYLQYPNQDNVLGPTRPFFSTYLESIWLLNVAHAASLLEQQPCAWSHADASRLRDELVAPSASLIAGYNEGGSNRQVWNEAAICSAWSLLQRDDQARQRLRARGGVAWQIDQGLDAAGSWYEGENYHLFAHRGLWYGVQLMHALGDPPNVRTDARFAAGFVAPFAGVLPDETFPSRRDSQYGVSVRQWRTAEWCELGWAYARDARIAGLLTRLYDGRAPARDTQRWRSTADAERNTPAARLTRADLSWRALLMAASSVEAVTGSALSSVCEPAQGLSVIRRDRAGTYVALEGGQLGGGHGHPDQLALTLQTGEHRWLEDPGTGSYVEPELQWYRSTMAHAAPLVDGVSQAPVPATLIAFDDRGGIGWIVKRVDDMAPGVSLSRTVVVGDGYLVDVVEWSAAAEHTVELPIAGDATVMGTRTMWADYRDTIERGLESPLQFASALEYVDVSGTVAMSARPTRCGPDAADTVEMPGALLWYACDAPARLVRAVVPAAPGRGRMPRHWLQARAAHGRIVGVWSWPSGDHDESVVRAVQLSPDRMPCASITTRDGTVADHGRAPHGWHVDLRVGSARSSLDLDADATTRDGLRTVAASSERGAPGEHSAALRVRVPLVHEREAHGHPGAPIAGAPRMELGEAHYVGTEQSWRDAGSPDATLQIATTPTSFILDIVARTGHVVVPASGSWNPLDNEPADVNADGVQWYFRPVPRDGEQPKDAWTAAGLHVPVADGADAATPRATALVAKSPMPTGHWLATSSGWAMRLVWPLHALPVNSEQSVGFECVVNERPEWRERRRGQLVLGGGGGFGYLAGARREPTQFLRLDLAVPVSTDGSTTLR